MRPRRCGWGDGRWARTVGWERDRRCDGSGHSLICMRREFRASSVYCQRESRYTRCRIVSMCQTRRSATTVVESEARTSRPGRVCCKMHGNNNLTFALRSKAQLGHRRHCSARRGHLSRDDRRCDATQLSDRLVRGSCGMRLCNLDESCDPRLHMCIGQDEAHTKFKFPVFSGSLTKHPISFRPDV